MSGLQGQPNRRSPSQPLQAQPVQQGRPLQGRPVQARPLNAQPLNAQPVRAVPAQAVPAQALPAQPARAVPAQAVPAQALPAQPARAVPAQAVPAQAVPAQPARAVPAQAVPAQAARAVPAQAVAAQPAPQQPKAPPLDVSKLGRFERLLYSMEGYGASDLHLKARAPVIMRIKGEMRTVSPNPLANNEINALCKEVTDDEQWKLFEETGDLDFAYMLPNRARFRFNIFREKRTTAVVVRRISTSIPSFEQLNLPTATFKQITSNEDGMIILAGVTGSGKSTTIAGMLDYINTNYPKHIITIEDPIEYEFSNKKSYISQREIGVDCVDFKAAIRTLVRQDPDVVLIGEMRDEETFEFGLTAAETGHLVFGTLHAGTVAQSIGRILGLFPPNKHTSLRQALEFNLRAVICQKLLPSIRPNVARCPILEIMICNPAIKKLIKEGKDKEINDIVARREEGMMLFDQCLVDRVNEGLISREAALEIASNPEQLKMALSGIKLRSGK